MLIRYPGSKDKHIKFLEPYLSEAIKTRTIFEPFSGTAAVTFYLLKNKMVDYYHINDIDPALVSLWRTVKTKPEYLVERILAYTPNVDDFYEFKKNIGAGEKEQAFRKLVLHQVSYSGLGAKAGGPLGGKNQLSKYDVGCRWSPKKLITGIRDCSTLLNSVDGVITEGSWESVLDAAEERQGFIYLDPPYFNQGTALYAYGGLNHEQLAERLHTLNDWVVSYDDTPEIRGMFKWANVRRLDVTSHLHHKVVGDVVIIPSV